MGNSLECEKIFRDELNGDGFSLVGSVGKENSNSSAKQAVKSPEEAAISEKQNKFKKQAVKSQDKAPIFGKKSLLSEKHVNAPAMKVSNKALTQAPVTAAEKSASRKSGLSCSQPSFGRPSNARSSVRSYSRERDNTPEFDEKDKKYWYREYKHQKGIVRRLRKDLQRSNNKFRKISKEIKVLSDMV